MREVGKMHARRFEEALQIVERQDQRLAAVHDQRCSHGGRRLQSQTMEVFGRCDDALN